jgi:spoIIIJ-associated protein
MDSIEIEAKSVAEAITIACEELKTKHENLTIEVLQEAPNKIFAFMSGKKARIRATLIPAMPAARSVSSAVGARNADAEGKLQEVLETIVRYINPDASVAAHDGDEGIVLNIIGDGSGIFIGRQGQTLDALQYLINKIKVRYGADAVPVTVDSEAYRARHDESLANLAVKLGDKAKKRGGPVTTNLLNPAERRIIHLTLQKDAELTTWSKGEGVLKKVIITPRQAEKSINRPLDAARGR